MSNFKRGLVALACLLTLTLMLPMVTRAQSEEDATIQGITDQVQTGVNIQNAGSAAATVNTQLLPQGSGSAINLPDLSLPVGGVRNYFLPTIGNVTAGSYSLVATADQPIEAIVRTDFQVGNSIASGIYSSVQPGQQVIVPLVTRGFTAQTNLISVQNASTTQASTFELLLVGLGKTTANPDKTVSNQTLQAGRSQTFDLRGNDFADLPDNGTPLGVADGFVGFALVRVTTGADVVVQSFIDINGVPAVTSFSGVAADSASTTLYAPLLRANYFGDTGVQIINPNNSEANVTISFITDPQSPSGNDNEVFTHAFTVTANSSFIAFQGPTGNSRTAGLPGGTGQTGSSTTPNNTGWFGPARITSNVPVLAVVNDVFFGANFSVQQQSTYNAVTSNEASTRVALPLVRSRHVAGSYLTTGIQVQNTTDQEAQVTLTVSSGNPDDTATQTVGPRTIPANGSLNIFQGDSDQQTLFPQVGPALGGAGWFGSGIIQSNQPVVLIVQDINFPLSQPLTQISDSANYNGLPIQQ